MDDIKMREGEWFKIAVSIKELCLDTTLRCGQSFRWRKLQNHWVCTLEGRIISLKQDDNSLYCKAAWPTKIRPGQFTNRKDESAAIWSEEQLMQQSTNSIITDYLQLKPNAIELYEKWSAVDPNFKKKASNFAGLRILRQPAWECLVEFICSSANNIPRITQMVGNLEKTYGKYIGNLYGEDFYSFPTPDALSGPDTETELRKLMFGYRAKFVHATARAIATEKPENWLQSLCNTESYEGPDAKLIDPAGRPGYRKAHEELIALQGVGPKVADCICLMGLGWGESVPVDTHVLAIAKRDYGLGKGATKSLNKKTYDAIANHFRSLWGLEAGWAHSVLFAADLNPKTFAVRLVEEETETKDETAIKTEKKVVAKVQTTTKRRAMKEEMVKDEPGLNSGILSETKAKKVKVESED